MSDVLDFDNHDDVANEVNDFACMVVDESIGSKDEDS